MTKGGIRQGSGRPVGSGEFKEKTIVMRVPLSSVAFFEDYLAKLKVTPVKPTQTNALPPCIEVLRPAKNPPVVLRPLASHLVPAGFPSPADDYIDKFLDLNEFLIDNPDSTYFYRVTGLSMIDIGIYPGDILVVDRSKTAKHGDIVIANVDNEFTIKRFEQIGNYVALVTENTDFPTIVLHEGQELMIWGVVLHCIHTFKRGKKP